MITEAAEEAATLLRSPGTSGEPDLKTNWVLNLFSSGMIRLKVSSISIFGLELRTTTEAPPLFLYAEQICTSIRASSGRVTASVIVMPSI